MGLRKGETVEVTVDRMAFGGHGVARVQEFVVFVRGAVAGDRVRARIYKKKRNYAEARIEELLVPSPDRINPPCRYSGHCGGCQWQNLRYETQLHHKKEHVRESVRQIGRIKDVVIHDVIPSENIFGYRNKMEFSFSGRRWYLPEELDRKDRGDGFALGLHVPGSFSRVIDVEECLLQHKTGNQILEEVRKYAKQSGIPVYNSKTHDGFWRFLALRYSAAFNEWMVNLVTSEKNRDILLPLTDMLENRIKGIKTVVNNVTSRKASIAVGEQENTLLGDGYIHDRIGPFAFRISANSFFQTNSRAAEKLYQKVMEYADLTGREMVLDLYSGTGTIPIFISGMARRIIGMEISRSAIVDAQTNCDLNDVDNCSFVYGDIREKLPGINTKPDVLVIDPPRAGMHKDVLTQAMALSAKRLVYISCNPSTMARDLGQLAENYEIVEIQPVDMFPHTYHIETVARLRLRE